MSGRSVLISMVFLAACSAPYETTPPSTRNITAVEAEPASTATPLGAGSYADAATTAAGLSQGFVEANPIIAPCGIAAPVCGLAVKQVTKAALIEAGVTPETAQRSVEAGGWLGACANLATFAGAAPPLAIAVGAVCAGASLTTNANGPLAAAPEVTPG